MTKLLFYKDPYIKEFDARIVKIDGNKIYLDKTAFYPEGGGQPSDRGKIIGDGFELDVIDVQKDGDIAHIVRTPKGAKIGNVHCKIDWNRRYDFMQQHTGHHILAAAIKRVLGADVFGSVIFEDVNKMEFKGDPRGSIRKIEALANGVVWSSLPVKTSVHTPDNIPSDLRKIPKKGLSEVRIVRVGDFDAVPCAGTHVKNSAEVGIIKITSAYRKTKDVWRVEFVCGFRALKYMNDVLDERSKLKEKLNSNNLVEAVEKLVSESTELRKRLHDIQLELALGKVSRDGKVCYYIGDMDMKFMEELAVRMGDCNVALASTRGYVLLSSKSFDVKNLMKEITNKFGGKGGGGTLVRAGGVSDPTKALEYAVERMR